MRNIIKAIAPLIGLLLMSCQHTSTTILNGSCSGTDCRGRVLTILPIPLDGVSIQNKNDVVGVFSPDGRSPEVIIQDTLYKAVLREISRTLDAAKMSSHELPFGLYRSKRDTLTFLAVKLPMQPENIDGGDHINVYVPKSETLRDSVDIGLSINEICLGVSTEEAGHQNGYYTPGATVMTPGGAIQTAGHWTGGSYRSSSDKMEAGLQFIVWDYKNSCPITYGVVNVDQGKSMSSSTWASLFQLIARTLLEKSSLK